MWTFFNFNMWVRITKRYIYKNLVNLWHNLHKRYLKLDVNIIISCHIQWNVVIRHPIGSTITFNRRSSNSQIRSSNSQKIIHYTEDPPTHTSKPKTLSYIAHDHAICYHQQASDWGLTANDVFTTRILVLHILCSSIHQPHIKF